MFLYAQKTPMIAFWLQIAAASTVSHIKLQKIKIK